MKQSRLSIAIAIAFATITAIFALAAHAQSYNSPERDGVHVAVPQSSNTVIYAGSIVALNSSGEAVPADATPGLVVLGRAERTSDATGALYDADKRIVIKRGIFRWDAATNTITRASIGSLATVINATTVGTTAQSTNVIAGRIADVDSDGIWVDTRAR